MSRLHNFSAGPAALPAEVITKMAAELPDWNGIGSSVAEVSHRGKEFIQLTENLFVKLRALFHLPDDYEVIAMSGGATAQFSAIPLNLAGGFESADYLINGHWSRKAAQLAENCVKVNIVHDAGKKPSDIAAPAEWQTDPAAAYFHYCHNETVDGLAFPEIPARADVGGVPLIADISSCIGSYPLDFSRWDLAYACAQKNMGIAGLTLVFIRADLLERSIMTHCPSVMHYAAQHKAGSLLNTPVTFAFYVCDLMCDWMLEQGGVAALGKVSRRKSDMLYDAIDNSEGFYTAPIAKSCRSLTNPVFDLPSEEEGARFLEESRAAGFLYLKGHRVRGGMRASIYNAVSVETVTELVRFMRDYAKRRV